MRASSHFLQGNGVFRWLHGKLLFLGATPTWVTKHLTVVDYSFFFLSEITDTIVLYRHRLFQNQPRRLNAMVLELLSANGRRG